MMGLGCAAELVYHGRSFEALTHQSGVLSTAATLWVCAIVGLICSVKANASLHRTTGFHGARLARLLGVSTYPLYLLHAKVGQVLISEMHHFISYGYALAVSVLLLLGTALIVAEWLEPPTRLLLQSIWRA